MGNRVGILRKRLNFILEPEARRGIDNIYASIGFFTDLFIMASIIISCIIIPMEYSLPRYGKLWISLEIFFAILFSIEYLLRWFACENRLKYPFKFYSIIDLAAILPSLLLVSNNFMVLRLFRFARFLRLLKLIRYNYYLYNSINNLKNRFSALREDYQLDHLGNLFFLSVIALVVGANLVYITETEFADGAGPYSNYWNSYWNIIIVLISGIEDKEPLSLPGKIEVTLLLIAGICVVGMITAEIVSILVGKFSRKGRPALKPLNSRMENHIVILGENSHLDYVIRQVYRAFSGRYYILVVCRNIDALAITIPHVYKKVVVVKGDPLQPEVLNRADIGFARRIIVLAGGRRDDEKFAIDNKSLMKSLAAASLNPNVDLTVQLLSSDSLKYTRIMNKTDFIISSGYMEKLISQGVLNPGVTEIYRSLMTFSLDSNEFYKIEIPENFEPETFTQAGLFFLENRLPVIPVGLYSGDECMINPTFLFNGDIELKKGDFLLVIAYKRPDFVMGRDGFSSYKERLRKRNEKRILKDGSELSPHNLSKNSSFKDLKNRSIVICNCNETLKNIVEELLYGSPENLFSIKLIVENQEMWNSNPGWHPGDKGGDFEVIFGDPAREEVLLAAGVEDCGAAVILANPAHGELADGPSALIALAVEKINPEIHTIMELINSVNREYIDSGIINEVVCLGDVTEKLIAQNCHQPGVINIFDNLLTSGKGTPQIFLPKVPEGFINRSYGDIAIDILKKKSRFILMGFIKGDDFYINPETGVETGLETILDHGDRLIIIAHDLNPVNGF